MPWNQNQNNLYCLDETVMRKMDNTASDMIPIRLIISIVVIAAMVVMISVGYNNLGVALAKNQVETECGTVESKLYTMISSGIARNVDEADSCDGTKRTYTFDLPDNLIFLAFGVDGCGTELIC